MDLTTVQRLCTASDSKCFERVNIPKCLQNRVFCISLPQIYNLSSSVILSDFLNTIEKAVSCLYISLVIKYFWIIIANDKSVSLSFNSAKH